MLGRAYRKLIDTTSRTKKQIFLSGICCHSCSQEYKASRLKIQSQSGQHNKPEIKIDVYKSTQHINESLVSEY